MKSPFLRWPPLARLWLLSFAAWSVPAVLESAQSLFQPHQAATGVSWWDAWLRYGPKYYFWALLTPLAWYLARRVPLNRPRRRGPALLVHTAAGLGLGAVHLSFSAAYYYVWWNRDGEPFAAVLEWYFANVFAFELLIYPVVVGAYHLVSYHQTVRRQELESARLQTSLAEARFNALQSRLHPHFLFNALNALVGLLRYDRNAEAIRAIGELGHLLRDALDETQGQERSLEEELEWAERYLAIEQLRIGPRMTIVLDIEDGTLDAAVPRLLLQPLLENAIRHGIAPVATAGEIRLSARRREDRLLLEIEDDGPGPISGTPGHGVGLSTTRARLMHLYGDRQAITLRPGHPRGARLSIELPLRHLSDQPPERDGLRATALQES